MARNHLYVSENMSLLIVDFPRYLADNIAAQAGIVDYNLYTNFTIPISMGKIDLLHVYKKDDSTEIPLLGLSAKEMKYIYFDELYD